LAGVIAGSYTLVPQTPWAPFLTLIVLAGVIFLWMMASACGGSRAALIAYAALVVFITDAAFRSRAPGETSADWQNLLKFVVWLGAGSIGYFQMQPLRNVLSWPPPTWLLAFVVLCLLSSVYSLTPTYSLGCSLALLSLYPFASALVRKLSEAEILWTLVGALTAFLVTGWVVYYGLPPLGAVWEQVDEGGVVLRMSGIAGHPNELGTLSAIQLGAIFLLWYVHRCRLAIAIPLAAIGLITLIASDSRTAMVELVLASAAVLLRRSPLALGGALLAAALGLLICFAGSFSIDELLGQVSRSGNANEVLSLTGRLEIWNFVLQRILESPIIGWGYNSSKFLLSQHPFVYGLTLETTHNVLLQVLLSVGLVGTLPVMALLVHLGIDLVRRPAPFRDFFYVASLVDALTESNVLGSTPTLFTLLLFMAAFWPARAGRDVA
jgi:O-antigen ligase